jgi:TolB protein
MMRNRRLWESIFYRYAKLSVPLLVSLLPCRGQSTALGAFEGQGDVGTVLHAGSGEFDPAAKTYTLTGSGENMWTTGDNFHFVWKKVSGDVSLAARIILGEGSEGHRKSVLMIRQSLDADAPYADVAVHGDGLTSLQYRDEKGETTHEIQSYLSAPESVRIEKHGDRFYVWVAAAGEQPHFAGGSARVVLQGPFYVGLGVCAHNKDNLQKAVFSDVNLGSPSSTPTRFSTIQTIAVSSTDSRAAYVSASRIESPNWSPDGNSILFRSEGKVQQVPITGGEAKTASPHLPEIMGRNRSPDGQFVYTSSNRSGTMQIWRTAVDGSNPEQLTHDDANDVSPSLSLDGKQVVFLSYPAKGAAFPEETDVEIRVLSLADNKVKLLAKIVGGKNTLGAQPWSPDSKRLIFVSYQTLH